MSERPLRVAVDARVLNVTHLRGMGKAVYELVRRTAASGAIEWHLLADRPDLPMRAPEADRVHTSVFEQKGYRFHLWEQLALPATARRLQADLLHAAAISMPLWQPIPSVVTVHDTIPWQDQDPHWPAGWYRDRMLPAAYHRAAAVMTISDSSRRDILARWPKLKQTLHVVSLGVDERYLEAVPDWRPIEIDGRSINEPYLLYVGGADPRKRLLWALQTWWTSAAKDGLFIVCGLEPAAHDDIRRLVPRELRERLIVATYIDEDEMPRLYLRATAVLYPSLYEGFGLPVVEAQAVGTPVLFSDVGSLSELKGPGAVVLPVDDLQAWVRMASVLHAQGRGSGPDRIARAWAQQYSWDAFTDRTLAIYHEVLERRRQHGGRDRVHSRATS